MLCIDTHTHIIPKNLPNFKKMFGYDGFIKMDYSCKHSKKKNKCDMILDNNKFFRTINSNCWDIDVRNKECLKNKVSHQILSTIPVMFSYWAKPIDCLTVCQFLNNDLINLCNNQFKKYNNSQTSFHGLCSVPLQDTELACIELDRCMKLGFKGVMIGSHIESSNKNGLKKNLNLGDKRLEKFWKKCEELNAVIFVHPWDMPLKNTEYWLGWLVGMPMETSLAICHLIFSGIFEKFPKIKIYFAHGGGSFPITIGRIEHGFNVRPDLCQINSKINPRKYLSTKNGGTGQIYVDSLVHDIETLKYNIELFGEDNIVFGSDYPFPLGELEPSKMIRESDLNIEIKNKILFQNSCNLFNL